MECTLADSGLLAVLQAAALSTADNYEAGSASAMPCAAAEAEAQHTGSPDEQAAAPVAAISAASDAAGSPAAVGASDAGQPDAGTQEHVDGHTLAVTDSVRAPAAEPDSSSALQLSSQGPNKLPPRAPPAAAASGIRQPLGQSRRREPAAASADGRSAQHQGPLPSAGRVPALPPLLPPLSLHSQQPAPQPQGSGPAGAAEKRPPMDVRGLPPAKRPKSSGSLNSAGGSSGEPPAPAAANAGALMMVPQDLQLATGRCDLYVWLSNCLQWLLSMCCTSWRSADACACWCIFAGLAWPVSC